MAGGDAFDFEHFPGFAQVRYTQVPDLFFDRIAPLLSEAELRVILYIFRHTFGWKKDFDRISLAQMVDGIRRQDGSVVDLGTGMAKTSVVRGVKGLIEKRLIEAVRQSSPAHGHEPTVYQPRVVGDPQPLVAQSYKGRQRKATSPRSGSLHTRNNGQHTTGKGGAHAVDDVNRAIYEGRVIE